MRLRIRVFCALFCAGFVYPTLPPSAMAAVYSERQALPAQTIQEFLANPNALLAEFPDGGPRMISRVRDLAGSDPATLNPLIGLLRAANAQQSTAIGTGLGHTALMAVKTDQAYANQIQEALAAVVGSNGATSGANNAPPASAQPKIGSVVKVKDQVEGITEKGTQRIADGAAIYLGETLRTGPNGKAELLLADRTNLSILPQTEVRVEKFVYDPGGGPGSVVVDVHSGSFRFITGVQASQNYEVKTPHGTVHVHGTEFVVVVSSSGLQIQVASGQLTVTSASGQQVTLSAGSQLSISSSGVMQGPTASSTPLASFADLGLPTTNVTLAQALAAFSAATGNSATLSTAAAAAAASAATGGAGGGGGGTGTGPGGTGGNGTAIVGLGFNSSGGSTTPNLTTFVVSTPGNVAGLTFTATPTTKTTTTTTTTIVNRSVSPH
jgi:FecR protein